MATRGWPLLLLLTIISCFVLRIESSSETNSSQIDSSFPSCYAFSSPSFNRSCFPNDFLFGTASSAYQYEGAVNEGGRTPSIWDTFSHKFPERTSFGNGDVAIDFYHRYKDDIKLMKHMNNNAFRLSISWSRILPYGRYHKNQEGINFYKNLLNELIANGIKPSVTIFHWDLPQTLEDEYGGFLSRRIVKDFREFARICFEEFGDKVDVWATFNEPWVYAVAGYDRGAKAPGRCSKWVNDKCEGGNSATEPYIVSHHLLLAHAAAVQEFRKCHKCKKINAKIGMVFSPAWFVPHSDSHADKQAAKRALEFMLGWHLDPATYGDYPKIMKKLVGARLPRFTPRQSKMLKNSYDYVGINYYSSLYAANVKNPDPTKVRSTTDNRVEWKTERDGVLLGPLGALANSIVYEQGIRNLVNYTKNHYNNPEIYIAENGFSDRNNGSKPLKEALNDTRRTDYHQKHLLSLLRSVREDGAKVKGYFVWSLMDNFEWDHGYNIRFGLYHIDYKNNLTRYARDSAKWYTRFLAVNK